MLRFNIRLAVLAGLLTLASPEWADAADSKVFIQNNTPYTLRFKTTVPCSGKECEAPFLNKKHWKGGQKAYSVKPWGHVELFETERRAKDGIKSKAIYRFNTVVKADGWASEGTPFQVRLKLKGRGWPRRSYMWHGVRDSKNNHKFYDGRRVRYGHWAIRKGSKKKAIRVRYQRLKRAGSSNIEFTFQEDYPLPTGVVPNKDRKKMVNTDGHHLNILSWNVFMRARILGIGLQDGQTKRAVMIPPKIQGYDVVVFQEVMSAGGRKRLVKGMKRYGYRYVSDTLGRGKCKPRRQSKYTWNRGHDRTNLKSIKNGGVLIVSKWPIVRQECDFFGHICDGSDCMSKKGVLYVKINKLGRHYHVFGTHLENGHFADVQKGQLKVFQQFAAYINPPRSEAVLYAGDFNISRTKPGQYSFMLEDEEALQAETAALKPGSHQYTHDKQVSDLVGPNHESEDVQVDYVFYSTKHLKPAKKSFTEIRVLRADDYWRRKKFTSRHWDLSDHFAVYGSYNFEPSGIAGFNPGVAPNTLVPVVRYWSKKRTEIAEATTDKRQAAFKKAGYGRVGVLGWAFRTCGDAERYASNFDGGRKIGGRTRALSFYSRKRRIQKTNDYFTETGGHYRRYRKHDTDVCVFTENALVAKPSMRGSLVPIYRYFNKGRSDNLIATNPGDHQHAKQGRFCLVCGPGKVECGPRAIQQRISRRQCVLGYLARANSWSKRRCNKDTECDKGHVCLLSPKPKAGSRGRAKARVGASMARVRATASIAKIAMVRAKRGVCGVAPPK